MIESDVGASGRQVIGMPVSDSTSSSCEEAEAMRDLVGSLV